MLYYNLIGSNKYKICSNESDCPLFIPVDQAGQAYSTTEYLKGFIKLADHGRNTRNSNNTNILKVPKTNLKLREKSFKF